MVVPVEGLFTVSERIGVAEVRGSSTGSTITIFNSLKASMVTGFAEMSREKTTLMKYKKKSR